MAEPAPKRQKLHGREFYKSIGSPKYVVAPMVDQSEYAWRMLTRSFMTPETNKDLLAYTPMFHARLFATAPQYRDNHFQPSHAPLPEPSTSASLPETVDSHDHLDGNPTTDRPLFVQFCTNEPSEFLSAARYVAPYCDAVDLNLGCPQGIARKGRYGAFLQEDWPTIQKLISTLHADLPVPVTAKFRVQETPEKTLEYARMILDAGASIITVHGRRREQKGHNTGLADWSMIRYLRDNLPADTVIFANGNILQHEDIATCLAATGADAVMSAEGNLSDPTIFATPPAPGAEGRDYWRGPDGRGGYRMDAVLRRYMDITHTHVLGEPLPERKPLWIPSDGPDALPPADPGAPALITDATDGPPQARKKQHVTKRQQTKNNKAAGGPGAGKESSPNLTAMQSHLFSLLRPLVAHHTHIRDVLARSRAGDMASFERVLGMVEHVVAVGIRDHLTTATATDSITNGVHDSSVNQDSAAPSAGTDAGADADFADPAVSSAATRARCHRPWFICQPYVRPLPAEALAKGALQLTKKELKKQREADAATSTSTSTTNSTSATNASASAGPEGGEAGKRPRSPAVEDVSGTKRSKLRAHDAAHAPASVAATTAPDGDVPRQAVYEERGHVEPAHLAATGDAVNGRREGGGVNGEKGECVNGEGANGESAKGKEEESVEVASQGLVCG